MKFGSSILIYLRVTSALVLERFWNDLDVFCILGDLNGWRGDRTRTSIAGALGVPGENDKVRRVLEFCAERRLCR